jgi:putative holliday junction resolvase
MTGAPLRFLGIDHGTRRIGLAYGDDIGVATPLGAISADDAAKRWAGLAAVVKERRITEVVLGHPINMDGSSGPKALEVEAFARRIQSEFGLPVHLVDERLTSYEAESTIPPSKRRAVRKTGLVDSRAATIILQDFLDGRIPGGSDPEKDS